MFVTVIHKIHDPEGFQQAEEKALAAGLPTHVALPIHAANTDHTLGICIWEGESVATVKEVWKDAVGREWADNEYYEMSVDRLTRRRLTTTDAYLDRRRVAPLSKHEVRTVERAVVPVAEAQRRARARPSAAGTCFTSSSPSRTPSAVSSGARARPSAIS